MKSKILITALAATFLSISARANLIGNTITATDTWNYVNPTTATIGAAVEFTHILGYVDMDFGANTLTISASPYEIGGWGGFGFVTFAGFSETITGFSLLSNSGFYSASFLSNYSFTANSLTLDMNHANTSLNPVPNVAVFQINTASSSVPDSGATLALLGSAMLGLAALRRRFAA